MERRGDKERGSKGRREGEREGGKNQESLIQYG